MRVLLGPILFAMDVAPANIGWGIALTVILVPTIALVAVRPRRWTALASGLALLTWLLLGIIGEGIDC